MKCRHETPCSQRCLGTKELDPCRGYDKCKDFQPNYMTNADRIRAMSDEELAEMLLDGCRGSMCSDQSHNDYGSVDCFKCRMDWLKQSVKDGE
jgi:hypothetical protein